MYTYNDFNCDFSKAKEIVTNAGLPACLDNNYTLVLTGENEYPKFLGRTTKLGENLYSVTMNAKYCDLVNENEKMKTIIHEILHSLPDGMRHTGQWKEYCKIVKNYNGMEITTKHDRALINEYIEDRTLHAKPRTRAEKKEYVVECPHCHMVLKTFERECKTVKNIENYRCGKCKGNLVVYVNDK